MNLGVAILKLAGPDDEDEVRPWLSLKLSTASLSFDNSLIYCGGFLPSTTRT